MVWGGLSLISVTSTILLPHPAATRTHKHRHLFIYRYCSLKNFVVAISKELCFFFPQETKSFHGKSSLLEWEERGRKEQLADSLPLADSPSRWLKVANNIDRHWCLYDRTTRRSHDRLFLVLLLICRKRENSCQLEARVRHEQMNTTPWWMFALTLFLGSRSFQWEVIKHNLTHS